MAQDFGAKKNCWSHRKTRGDTDVKHLTRPGAPAASFKWHIGPSAQWLGEKRNDSATSEVHFCLFNDL